MLDSCINCHSTNLRIFKSYKSIWQECVFCNWLYCHHREKYPFENILKKTYEFCTKIPILRGLTSWANPIIRNNNVWDWSEEYKSSEEDSAAYKKEYSRFSDLLNRLSIPKKGALLDLSGEPGHFAEFAKRDFDETHLTVYSEKVAEAIKTKKQIKTTTYDFNKESLEKIYDQKFNFIIARYCLNYCKNINGLAEQLSRVTNDNAIVFLSFILPSCGTIVRWGLVEFIDSPLFFTADSLISIFAKNGFELVYRGEDGAPIPYDQGFRYPLKLFYKLYKKINKFRSSEMIHKNYILILRKKGPLPC